MTHHTNRNRNIAPEEIDVYLKMSLHAYLDGKLTEKELTRMLHAQLHGNSTRLSIQTVSLLTEYEQLLTVLQKENKEKGEIKKIIEEILERLI